MNVRVEAPVLVDLVEGYTFYEDGAEGLGDYFLASLFSEIEALRIFGGIHRREYRGLYRALSRKFPFAIYYSIASGEVVVKAVLDCRKNPSWIRSRLNKKAHPESHEASGNPESN
jgi:hypothetical protein